MKCSDITPGMICTFPQVAFDGRKYPPGDWKIVRGATSMTSPKFGRLLLDNSRKNKWYAKPVNSDSPPELVCFALEFPDSAYNFRKP